MVTAATGYRWGNVRVRPLAYDRSRGPLARARCAWRALHWPPAHRFGAPSANGVGGLGFVGVYDGGMRSWFGILVDVWSHGARSLA
jgi:hypothetical protein